MAEGRLREVEEDAVRITQRRFRDQEEDRQIKLQKAEGAKPQADLDNPTDASVAQQVSRSDDKKGKK